MSSGYAEVASVVALPVVAVAAIPVAATIGVGYAITNVVRSVATRTKNTVEVIKESNLKIAEMKSQEQRRLEIFSGLMDEIGDMSIKISAAANQGERDSEKLFLMGKKHSDETDVFTGSASDEIFVLYIDPDTKAKRYEIIDFSDAMGFASARNSEEFKKMKYISDISAEIAGFCLRNDEETARVSDFLNALEQMLVDGTVHMGDLHEYCETRMKMFRNEFSLSLEGVSEDLAVTYRTVCLMNNEEPFAKDEKTMVQEIERISGELYERRFNEKMVEAFRESLEELGLKTVRSCEYLGLEGTIVRDDENGTSSMFVSYSNGSCVMDAVVTNRDETDEEKILHDVRRMCKKQKELYAKMEEKGFPLCEVEQRMPELNELVDINSASANDSYREYEHVQKMRRVRRLNGAEGRVRAMG